MVYLNKKIKVIKINFFVNNATLNALNVFNKLIIVLNALIHQWLIYLSANAETKIFFKILPKHVKNAILIVHNVSTFPLIVQNV